MSSTVRGSPSAEEWRERVEVLTRLEHEQHIEFASEVIADTIEGVPSIAASSRGFALGDITNRDRPDVVLRTSAVPAKPPAAAMDGHGNPARLIDMSGPVSDPINNEFSTPPQSPENPGAAPATAPLIQLDTPLPAPAFSVADDAAAATAVAEDNGVDAPASAAAPDPTPARAPAPATDMTAEPEPAAPTAQAETPLQPPVSDATAEAATGEAAVPTTEPTAETQVPEPQVPAAGAPPEQAAAVQVTATTATVSCDAPTVLPGDSSDPLVVLDPERMYTAAEVETVRQRAFQQAEAESRILGDDYQSVVSKLEEERALRTQLEQVFVQYEETINHMIQEQSNQKTGDNVKVVELNLTVQQLREELKTTTGKLSELKGRYDELKTVAEQYRSNEKLLKDSLSELQKTAKYAEAKYNTLRAHAEGKIDSANEEIRKMKQAHEDELTLLRARLLKTESQVNGLKSQVEAKDGENAELIKLCDELLAKVEGKQAQE